MSQTTIDEFKKLEEKSLASLIPCRKAAYKSGTALRLVKNGMFLDLLSLYNGCWHYITTHRLPR